jgi:hypothetical protein
MATLDELMARREALMKARHEGVRAVEYADFRVEYRSDAEMASAISDLDRRIASASGAARVTSVIFSTSKGL